MDLPYRFPDPLDEARRLARAFGRLSSSDRFAEVAALMAFGWKTVASSPRRDAIVQRMWEQEAEAQRIQRELFRRHGR
jgi:hypothetical protein